MKHRMASLADCAHLGAMNHQLIRDEGHRNPITIPELEEQIAAGSRVDTARCSLRKQAKMSPTPCFTSNPTRCICGSFSSRGHRDKASDTGGRGFAFWYWPKQKRLTVEVLVRDEGAVVLARMRLQ